MTEPGVALITGAASGIGEAIARRMAADGAAVTIVDRDAERGEAVAASLDGARFVAADLASPEACRASAAAVLERHGRLDVLVNNAGFQHVAPIHEYPEDAWDGILAVVLSAAFHLAKAALPVMYSQGYGRIVNMSSRLGLMGAPFKPAYVAAKHGLNGLTKSIAVEGADRGVAAFAVCPSFVETPLTRGQIAAQALHRQISEDEVLERHAVGGRLLKRLLQPEEVADVVAYLCTDAATFLTGREIRLDGGAGLS